MKKPYFLLILATLGFSAGVDAQITVTNATFPVVGDTFRYVIDLNPVIAGFLTPPGGNQTWNFSGLQSDLTGTTIFRHPNTGAQSANFPGADLLVVGMGRESYFNVTNNVVELMGYYGSDPINIGINLLAPYSPPFAERRAPMNFFDINQASSGLLLPFGAGDMPANLLQQLPVTADSFRIRIALNRLDAVDAWGNLSIPGGSYEVLREKRTLYEEKRLDAKIPPLGWLDITDVALQSLGLNALGVDTTVTFHFFSNTEKEEIAVLQLNNQQNAVVEARFKQLGPACQLTIANITTSPESCPNANDGSIAVTAAMSLGTLTYAISGPVNRSNNTGVFVGLPDSIYTITVMDAGAPNCSATTTATVAAGVDAIPPTAVCFNQSVVFNGQDTTILLNANDLVQADDNCGVATIGLSPASVSLAQAGQVVPVTVTVTDQSGNTATCTSAVAVSGLPGGWSQTPDGVNCPGGNSIAYNPANEVWTAMSTNCFYGPPFTSDELAFAQYTLCGGGSITAQVTGIAGGQGWAGVIMRESNAAGAKKVQLTTNLSNFNRREVRYETNGQAYPQQILSYNRYWLRLIRTGNQVAGYTSPNGVNWYFAMAATVNMSNCIQVGLVLTNYQQTGTVSATFANVSATGGGNNLAGGSNAGEGLPILASSSRLEADFDLYPNPTPGELNLDLTQYTGKAVRLEVYSLQGQLMQFMEIDEVQTGVERMDISAYADGMYMVKVKSEGSPDVAKRVVLGAR
jgi:hypothetical protein